MSDAVSDLRAMCERIVQFVADRGDAWKCDGTPEHLLLESVRLMVGVANCLEASSIELERVK